jgi:hypothetical protein
MSTNSKKIDNKKLFDAFIELVKTFAIQYLLKFKGLKGWIAKLIFNRFVVILKKISVRIGQDQAAKERLEKYEQIISNPNTTPEDRRQAERDFLSGK